MSDWTAGYVADIGYTHGYYPELNPLRAQLPLAVAGVAAPQHLATACELGFGQGVSVNIHAAGGSTQWWGTDFNPAQAAQAREMAQASGSGARLFDASEGVEASVEMSDGVAHLSVTTPRRAYGPMVLGLRGRHQADNALVAIRLLEEVEAHGIVVPAEAIAIIIGVDRLLDMCRTTLNVIGDVTAATYVTRAEGYELLRPKPMETTRDDAALEES